MPNKTVHYDELLGAILLFTMNLSKFVPPSLFLALQVIRANAPSPYPQCYFLVSLLCLSKGHGNILVALLFL